MNKQIIKHIQSGYSYVNSPCCGARVNITRSEIKTIKEGGEVVRPCPSCYINNVRIKGKV